MALSMRQIAHLSVADPVSQRTMVGPKTVIVFSRDSHFSASQERSVTNQLTCCEPPNQTSRDRLQHPASGHAHRDASPVCSKPYHECRRKCD